MFRQIHSCFSQHTRATVNRKLKRSLRKTPNNVVRMTDEFRSLRKCSRGLTSFPLKTSSHWFKVCEWCVPNQDDWPNGLKLPPKIVTMKGERLYQMERQEMREAVIENLRWSATEKTCNKTWHSVWITMLFSSQASSLMTNMISQRITCLESLWFTEWYDPEDHLAWRHFGCKIYDVKRFGCRIYDWPLY